MNESRVTRFVPRGDMARRDSDDDQVQHEVLRELRALRRLFDEFAGAYLNARFPHGKANDRWSRR